jgi:hypothetical protein
MTEQPKGFVSYYILLEESNPFLGINSWILTWQTDNCFFPNLLQMGYIMALNPMKGKEVPVHN